MPPHGMQVDTPKGPVCIRAFCQPDDIHGLHLGRAFRAYAQYKSILTKRDTLEAIAQVEGNNVVLALTPEDQIIGFGVLSYPEDNERWSQLGHGAMMEVKVIEVARDWRQYQISNDVMKMLMIHPRIEQMIAYMVGYSWTWDLDGTGLTAQQYRNMLIRIFTSHGFQEFQTNEPNICLKPENLFMGRVGKEVSEEMRKSFKWLCFGITP